MNLRSILAAGAVALAASGCGSTAATARHPSTVSEFQNAYLEFQYPAGWAAAEPDVDSTLHTHPMLYLSVQPTRNPCRTVGTATTCGWPVRRLERGGVLVVWENRGYPGWSLESQPGTPLRVGGRDARRLVSRPGVCKAIGADETVEIAIERPLPGNWTAVTACLRKPNLDVSERELAAVLATTRFKTR